MSKADDSGVCGENLTWAYNAEQQTLTISGTGEMSNYTSSTHAQWYEYRKSILQLIIENGVTSIGNYAFYYCSGLTSITIPNSVTSIGFDAFSRCSGLTSITIPNSVTSIGNGAFYGCNGLTSITIPNSVTSIGNSVFEGCKGLTSITISNSVTSIGERAFYNCSGLTSITIPNSVTNIGYCAFSGCSGLTSITISNSVTSIGERAFYYCSGLTSVTIGNSVTSIGSSAFYACSGLTSITVSSENTKYDSRNNCNAIIETFSNTLITGCMNTVIPNSVTSIGNGAFYGCNGLTSITIPNSVTSIGNGAFSSTGLTSITIPVSVINIERDILSGCKNLSSIIVEDGNPYFDSRYNCNAIIYTLDDILIAGCQNTVIPPGIREIGMNAFAGIVWRGEYGEPLSIAIPYSVTKIDYGAFSECKLPSIVLPPNIQYVGNHAFRNCSIGSLYIPNKVEYIDYYAFQGCQIYSVTIPSSIQGIGSSAFNDRNLRVVIVRGTTPVPIYESTFGNRRNAKLYVPVGCKEAYQAAPYWNEFGEIIETTSDDVFSDDGGTCGPDMTWHYVKATNTLTFSGTGYMKIEGEIPWDKYRENVRNIIIEEGITELSLFGEYYNLVSVYLPNSIRKVGFNDCGRLNAISIPGNVDEIYSFGNCEELTSICIPKSLTKIGGNAFARARHLKSIIVERNNKKYDSRDNCNAIIETSSNKLISGCMNTFIPNSVTSIGERAFYNCSGLTSITIPNSVTNIGYCAFSGCSSLTSITIPNSVTSIGGDAFYDCTGLTSVTIPNSVTSINNYTFSGCSGLTSITIPNSVTSIGRSAFSGCSGLTSITIPNSVTNIGNYAFGGCSGLTSIKVSEGNTKYDSRNNCNAIIETSSNTIIAGCKNTIIPSSVTSIGNSAFYGCNELTSITIPNSMTSIGGWAFDDCSGLTSVISEIQNPFDIAQNVFSSDTYSTATLTVPAGTKSKYQATNYWNKFTNIVEKEAEQANDEAFIEKLAQIEQECVLADKKLKEYNAKYYYIEDYEIGSQREVRSYYDEGSKDILGLEKIIASCEDKIAKGELVTQQERDELDEKYAIVRDNCSESITTTLMGYICTLTVSCNGGGQVRTWIDGREWAQDGYGKTTVRNETKTLYWLHPKFEHAYSNVKPGGYLEIIIEPDEGYVAEVNGKQVAKGIHLNGEGEYYASFTKSAMPTTYSLSISASGNGSVSYNGTTIRGGSQTFNVEEGLNATITFSPDNGYRIGSVMVNNSDVTYWVSNNQYSISNISSNTTVEVSFEAIPVTTYSLSIAASGNGSVSYNGTAIRNRTTSFMVDEGSSATVIFAPDNGNSIASVKLNNSDVTSQVSGNSYTISNITANTTLTVTFQEDVNALTVDGLNYTVTSQSNKTVTLTSGGTGLVLTVPATITQNGTTWKVTGIDKDALKGNKELAAVIWNPEAAFTATVSNPNLLLYVKSSDYAPATIQNVVVNGTASNIVLAEAKSGNNFYCPQSFVAQKISYTHNFKMQTCIGEARGWETIALPFDVQTITHATKGTIKPFANWKSGDTAKPFWLMELTGTGFVETGNIKAYTPYIISMPNNPQYDSQWLLNGKVTFAANSVTIDKTENLSQPTYQDRAFIPCFVEKGAAEGFYALNVSNDYETNNSGMTDGSRFVLNMRAVHPFEAYMTTASNAAPYIDVFDDMSTGIHLMVNGNWTKEEVVYDLQGRKLNNPSKKGVYIINGKKKIIR